jgi:NitT/TauT family transport system substrate-binding protein
MGIAKMISDNGFDSDKYSFTVFGDPVSAQDAFIAGDLDAICFPTNNAAKLYAKTNGQLYVTAINCLGSLYVISSQNVTINNIQDLEGKTIYASVPNSTTGAIIEYILKENNINAEVSFTLDGEELTSHDLLATRIGEGKIDIAILPEPKATATILTNPALGLSIDLNLSTEWERVSESTEPLTMGCIIFNKKFSSRVYIICN